MPAQSPTLRKIARKLNSIELNILKQVRNNFRAVLPSGGGVYKGINHAGMVDIVFDFSRVCFGAET